MLTHWNTWPILLPIHGLAGAGLALGWIGPWPLVIGLVVHGCLLVWGSFFPGSGFFLTAQVHGPEGTLALTFDDGPDPQRTPALLDLLKQEQVRASFFCIGERVRNEPDIVERMVREGHLVGGHSMDHPWNWGLLPTSKVVEQILQCQGTIAQVTGMRSTYFRNPFGVASPPVARAIARTGVHVVGWDVRTYDTFYQDPELALKKVFGRSPKGTIVLLHDTLDSTLATVERIIKESRKRGIRLVRVDEGTDRTLT
ncbi:MAG: polysaccharide deacetylase family protein [Flavobacteriales bacterium]|nr:polysaccharide deacetylase family protein [Flavobacteriales bacterium]